MYEAKCSGQGGTLRPQGKTIDLAATCLADLSAAEKNKLLLRQGVTILVSTL